MKFTKGVNPSINLSFLSNRYNHPNIHLSMVFIRRDEDLLVLKYIKVFTMIIEKLERIILLEKSQGSVNRAVIGGLANFISTWNQEASSESIDSSAVSEISDLLQNYKAATLEVRNASLSRILELLDRIKSSRKVNDFDNNSADTTPSHAISQTGQTITPSARLPLLTQNKMVPVGFLPGLDSPLTILPGIGINRANLLKNLTLHSLGDLLYFFPRRYDDYSKLITIDHISEGEVLSIIGSVDSISTFRVKNSNRLITQALITDGSGYLQLKWFNNPYIERQLKSGMKIIVSGKIEKYLGKYVINHPTWELLDTEHLNTNRIVPVYPLTASITQRTLRNLTHMCVNHWADKIPDIFPESILHKFNLISLSEALKQIHFPDNESVICLARNRLAFDEVFMMQLGVLRQKHKWESAKAKIYDISSQQLQSFISNLPFILTTSQHQAIEDIRVDLKTGHPMNRLLQGDVGSGKTAVAAAAIAIVCKEGAQSAVMAPTSILANQHYATLQKLLTFPGGFDPDQIKLLTSDTPAQEKTEIKQHILDGKIKILIGTHALIEEPINFHDLQLAIIDEQHRFGVEQRTVLRQKGNHPHLLLTSATPIPRSLALTIYGDLDLSVLDEMPKGRKEVKTKILPPTNKSLAYKIIQDEIHKGHQAFIVYPLIDQTDTESTNGAVQEFERLQKDIFPQHIIGLLHGRLRPPEKQTIMEKFRNKEIQILVTTTVIEVGMDIPNATVMLVDSANRFGLAQLHQLRGRIGRGPDESFCFLVSDSADSIENERLQIMESTNNGFLLAEQDLSQRGPGDFLGARQTGFIGFKMVSFTDTHLIEKARQCAKEIFQEDLNLNLPKHHLIRTAYNRYWTENFADPS